MKIAHIFKTYFPDTQGGLEEAIRQIARYTTGRGIENRIITLSDRAFPRQLAHPEADVIRFQTTIDILSTPMSLDFFQAYPRAIEDCDILHFHFPWPFAELTYLMHKIPKPAIVTYHADARKYKWIQLLYRSFMNRFLTRMDRIVVTSRQYLDSSVDLKPFRQKCRVIPLTLDPSRFSAPEAETLKTVKNTYGDQFFLFVGVLRPYKGIEYLLKAMQHVNGTLVIIGRGKEKAALRKQCRELGLTNVCFTGYVEDRYLPAFYMLCKAFVFPSVNRSEAFGVSLLEASYFGKPMITTELSTGTSYVNQHRVSGLIVPPGNVRALIAAMNTLRENETLCSYYGANAYRRLNNLFSPEISGNLYIDLYKEVLARQHH